MKTLPAPVKLLIVCAICLSFAATLGLIIYLLT